MPCSPPPRADNRHAYGCEGCHECSVSENERYSILPGLEFAMSQPTAMRRVTQYQGVIAMTRRGLPEPPTIFRGAAMTMAPVGES